MDSPKKRLFSHVKLTIFPALLTIITFFIFGVVDLYFPNQEELWFSVWEVLAPCAMAALVVLVVVLLVAVLLGKISSKVLGVFVAILFGLGLGFYLQGNLMPMDYGVLDGKSIQWEQYTLYGVLTTAVWLACLILPIVLLFRKPIWFQRTTRYASLFIIAIEILTLGTLLLTNDTSKKENAVFTTENQFNLSREKNTIVFIVDSMDAAYTNEMLAQFPEVKESFKDFVYYDDVLGVGPTTRGSLPYLLTGEEYLNQRPLAEYLEEAYESGSIAQILREEKIEADIYTDANFAVPTSDTAISNMQVVESYVNNTGAFLKEYLELVAFRYMPHYTKSFFWISYADFSIYQDNNDFQVYSKNNLSFYNSLLETGIKADRNNSVLKIYHIVGTHSPFNLDENLQSVENATAAQQARGCMRIIEEYLRQLKELDLYDAASIVIMADHGATDMNQCPSLLIKCAYSDQDTLAISHAPISYVSDWPDTLISLLTSQELPNTIWNISECIVRTREFYYYTWDNLWDAKYMPDLYEYRTTATARSLDSQKNFTGMIYQKHTTSTYKYQLGQICKFSDDDFYLSAVKSGITRGYAIDNPEENTFIWGGWLRRDAVIEMTLSQVIQQNAILHMEVFDVNGPEQAIEVVINGTNLGTVTMPLGETEFACFIPKGTIQSEKLTIEFHSPNARIRNNDPIPVSIAVTSLQLEETAEEALPAKTYPTLHEKAHVSFENGEIISDSVTVWGVYKAADSAAWSSEKMQLLFEVDEKEDLRFSVSYGTYYDDPKGIVTFNGHVVGALNKPYATAVIDLPKAYLVDKGPQIIEIVFPEAVSPEEYGESANSSVLGICITEMTLEKLVYPNINTDQTIFFQDNPAIDTKIIAKDMAPYGWTSASSDFLFCTDTRDDILLTIKYGTYYEAPNALVIFNGEEVGTLTESYAAVTLTLPGELIKPDDVQTLSITVPDAVSPKEYGYGKSETVMGICLSSMTFEFQTVPAINKNQTIFFQDNPAIDTEILTKNMAPYGWTSAASDFLFRTDTQDDILLTIDYGTYYDAPNAVVSFNGQEVGMLTESHAAVTLTLPAELIRPGDVQTLTITVPDAVSPKEYGYGESEMVMGLCLSSLQFDIQEIKAP